MVAVVPEAEAEQALGVLSDRGGGYRIGEVVAGERGLVWSE
jgi:hypothetical protein